MACVAGGCRVRTRYGGCESGRSRALQSMYRALHTAGAARCARHSDLRVLHIGAGIANRPHSGMVSVETATQRHAAGELSAITRNMRGT